MAASSPSFEAVIASWDSDPNAPDAEPYESLEERELAAYEASLKLEALRTDALELAGIRYVQFQNARGREVILIRYGTGDSLRALPVYAGELQVSYRRHPNRRSIGRLGSGSPIKPDVLANEVLLDLPEEERTADALLGRARENWELRMECERMLQLATAGGKLAVAAMTDRSEL